mmetsp:Transcript_9712/g.15257  ORF Transcript_9712/g.15257 Transcript_9712/m.15257 type:complete len:92 (-) Transcript_9712:670-945(-)
MIPQYYNNSSSIMHTHNSLYIITAEEMYTEPSFFCICSLFNNKTGVVHVVLKETTTYHQKKNTNTGSRYCLYLPRTQLHDVDYPPPLLIIR